MEQEDIEFINKELEEANQPMNKSVYKYQWSVKKDNGEIIVVTSDNKTELVLDIEWARALMNVPLSTPKPVVAQPQVISTPPITNPNTTKYTCNICGGPMNFIDAISKAGKPYKMLKCVAFPELVNNKNGVEGHSRFL